MQFTNGKTSIEKPVRGLAGFTVPEIYDTKDNRIKLIVDDDTLDGIRFACEEASKSGKRWDDLLKAICAYQRYKDAKKVVAAYEAPMRAAVVKEVFAGRKAVVK